MTWENSTAKRVCDKCFSGDIEAMRVYAEQYLQNEAVTPLGVDFRKIVLNQNRHTWWERALRLLRTHLEKLAPPQKSPVTMRSGNTGLTVKINLWSLDKVKDHFNAEAARLWVKGQVTHADTGEVIKFTDPGELLTALGRWNVEKLHELQGHQGKKK